MKKILYFSPRVLAILYIVFFVFFALDVFTIQSSVPFLYFFAAFLIHLIPSFVLGALLIIAWKYEKMGGILFILFAAALTILFDDTLPANIILFIPLIVIGILFLYNSNYRKI